MKIHTLTQTQDIRATIGEAWRFFANVRNLPLLSPPSARIRILGDPPEEAHEGMTLTHTMLALFVPVTWVSKIVVAEKPFSFMDEQQKGPFAQWRHRHSFAEIPGGVRVTDLVEYAVPFGPIGEIANALFVRPQLESTFAFRRKKLDELFGPPEA